MFVNTEEVSILNATVKALSLIVKVVKLECFKSFLANKTLPILT